MNGHLHSKILVLITLEFPEAVLQCKFVSKGLHVFQMETSNSTSIIRTKSRHVNSAAEYDVSQDAEFHT